MYIPFKAMKLLKSLVLIVLIFGVLYFGLKFYFSLQKGPVSEEVEQALKELRILREELSIIEQKIRDLRQENKPYQDEEEAVENIKARMQKLKQRIAAGAPSKAGSAEPVAPSTPEGEIKIESRHIPKTTIFSDTYQRVFVAIILGLVLLIIIVVMINRHRARTAQEPGPQQAQVELKDTLEKFKSAVPRMQPGETGEMDIEKLKSRVIDKADILDPMGKPEEEVPQTQAEERDDARVVEEVFELANQGIRVEEISERLRIDQDQVRLMLAYKPGHDASKPDE
jgi:hypothetical protein